MIIRLPFPPRALFPNRKAGKSWATSHAAKVYAREGAREAARTALATISESVREMVATPGKNIPVSLVFVAPDKRRRDLDGCLSASKAALDGIAQAMGVDDSRFNPILLNYVAGDKPGCTLIAIGVQIVSSQVIE